MPRLLALFCFMSLALPLVLGHTTIVEPKATTIRTRWGASSPYGLLGARQFASKEWNQVKKFWDVVQSTNVGSVRELIVKNLKPMLANVDKASDISPDCGYTLLDGDKRTLGPQIVWPWGHPGPCEAWCDENRFFFNEDCMTNKVGNIQVDTTRCKDAKRLQVYYLGLHHGDWEVYGACIPLTGSGAAPAADPYPQFPQKRTPNLTPTVGETPGPAPIFGATPTPTPTSGPPTQAQPTPTPSTKSNCQRRLRD